VLHRELLHRGCYTESYIHRELHTQCYIEEIDGWRNIAWSCTVPCCSTELGVVPPLKEGFPGTLFFFK
jgi:hypothetical protein